MKTRIALRARQTVIHTSTVHQESYREDELEFCIVTEPNASPYPAGATGIDPRPLRRQVFPRPGGAEPANVAEDRDV